MSKGGRYSSHNGNQRRPSKGGVIALVAVAVVLVVVLGVLLGGILYSSRRETVHTPQTEPTTTPVQTDAETTGVPTEATTEPTTVPTTLPYTESGLDVINILVVGQASRDGEDSRLADTMILATVNKKTKTLTLTSFLRDTYLKLPDYVDPSGRKHNCGKNRINVAYHLGWTWGGTGAAMEMVNQCMKENFGIEVDYDVEVDFEAFVKIINLIEGVTLDLTEAEADYLNSDGKVWQDGIQAGECWLDGDSALAYARMRKASGDSDSDIKRTARQRYLIEQVLTQVKGLGFSKLQELAQTVLPYITTNMTDDQITTCIWEILPLLPELKVETGTCPVQGSSWGEIIDLFGTPSSILQFDEGQNRKYMTALTEGTPLQ